MHLLSTAITFFVFFIEGLLHYNIGVNSGKSLFNLRIGFPNIKDFIYMISVLAFFSFLNGYIIHFIHSSDHRFQPSLEKDISHTHDQLLHGSGDDPDYD
tara:strand:+ start:4382 stop:4678 length:297 start_codon:yes stop_codon:yes gene_type:complete